MKKPSGFSLIELLVVITIMIVLLAISVSVYNNIQKSNRDQQRLRDLTLIKQALELYYIDWHSYPSIQDGTQQAHLGSGSDYIEAWPVDPILGREYVYVPLSFYTAYVICASSEGSKTFDLPAECPAGCGSASCAMGLSSD